MTTRIQLEPSTVKLRRVSGAIDPSVHLLVRELTGREDTGTLLVGRELLLWDVSPEYGRQVASRFAALGCEVELIDEPRFRYAYDPRHPERGDQPLERLRWVGNQLALDRGTLDHWSLGPMFELASSDELARAVAQQCEAWTRARLAIAADERSLLAALSEREPRLEAAIREADEPGDAVTVYLDWLQSRGDPRGWLDSGEPDRIDRHAAHLFGSNAPLLASIELQWYGGVLFGVTTASGRWEVLEPLFELLNLPICACLRSLRIEGGRALTEYVEAKLASVDPGVRAGIRSLVLHSAHGVSFGRGDLLPKLEALQLSVDLTRPLCLGRLRELSVVLSDAETAAAALGLSWLPQLRELTLRIDDPGWEGLDAVLSRPALQSVRSLVLDDLCFEGHPISLTHGPELMEQLLRASLIGTLERLDLRKLSPSHELVDAIAAVRGRLPPETLALGHAEVDEWVQARDWSFT